MTIPRWRSALAVAALWAAGCSNNEGPLGLTSAEQPGRIVVNFAGSINGPRDLWQLRTARIEGDTLHLGISHGGGCARHRYGLVAWNGWLESNPVQVHVALLHDNNGDMCDALLHPDLRFDLKPLRDAFAQAYGGPGGTIIINIDDPIRLPITSAARLTYTF